MIAARFDLTDQDTTAEHTIVVEVDESWSGTDAEIDAADRAPTLRRLHAQPAPRLPFLGEDYQKLISARLLDVRRGSRCRLCGRTETRLTAGSDHLGPCMVARCTVPGCGATQIVRMGDLA